MIEPFRKVFDDCVLMNFVFKTLFPHVSTMKFILYVLHKHNISGKFLQMNLTIINDNNENFRLIVKPERKLVKSGKISFKTFIMAKSQTYIEEKSS